jgi:hypothetical protein
MPRAIPPCDERSSGAGATFISTKPIPHLLWCFIEEDRNLILKEYDHRGGQSATEFVGTGGSQTT